MYYAFIFKYSQRAIASPKASGIRWRFLLTSNCLNTCDFICKVIALMLFVGSFAIIYILWPLLDSFVLWCPLNQTATMPWEKEDSKSEAKNASQPETGNRRWSYMFWALRSWLKNCLAVVVVVAVRRKALDKKGRKFWMLHFFSPMPYHSTSWEYLQQSSPNFAC